MRSNGETRGALVAWAGSGLPSKIACHRKSSAPGFVPGGGQRREGWELGCCVVQPAAFGFAKGLGVVFVNQGS